MSIGWSGVALLVVLGLWVWGGADAGSPPGPDAGSPPGPDGGQRRSRIVIVGPDLVAPYVAVLGRTFAADYRYPVPSFEAVPGHGATRLFCQGIGAATPDIVALAHWFSFREMKLCAGNGVQDIIEIDLGDDALVAAVRPGDPVFPLALVSFFYAVAERVPRTGGIFDELVANPHRTWADIDPSLPAIDLRIYGPAAGTVLHQVMKDFLLEGACRQIDTFKVYYSADRRVPICTALRRDGVYHPLAREDDRTLGAAARAAEPGALFIMPFTLWERHQDEFVLLPVDGILPDSRTIDLFEYPAVIPIRLFVKRAHMRPALGGLGVVAGLYEFVHAATAETMLGPDGALRRQLGLVVHDPATRAADRDRARRLMPYAP